MDTDAGAMQSQGGGHGHERHGRHSGRGEIRLGVGGELQASHRSHRSERSHRSRSDRSHRGERSHRSDRSDRSHGDRSRSHRSDRSCHSIKSQESHRSHGHRSQGSLTSSRRHRSSRGHRSHRSSSSRRSLKSSTSTHGLGAGGGARATTRAYSHRSRTSHGSRRTAFSSGLKLPTSPIAGSARAAGSSTSRPVSNRRPLSTGRLRLSSSAPGLRPPPSSRSQLPLETGLRKELDQTGVSRSLLQPQAHVLGYTGHRPGLLGLGQEVFTETAPVLERMLRSMSQSLTSQLHPVPMARGSVKWLSTTAKDVEVDGVPPGYIPRDDFAREYFRSSSEFSRYVDECIKRHLDPLGTGH